MRMHSALEIVQMLELTIAVSTIAVALDAAQ
jgi:hypothetical protein